MSKFKLKDESGNVIGIAPDYIGALDIAEAAGLDDWIAEEIEEDGSVGMVVNGAKLT